MWYHESLVPFNAILGLFYFLACQLLGGEKRVLDQEQFNRISVSNLDRFIFFVIIVKSGLLELYGVNIVVFYKQFIALGCYSI